jgi:hypothetical protein
MNDTKQMLADIRHLEANGEWPEQKQPAWAVKMAQELHCSSTSVGVIKWGLFEIVDAQEIELKQLRGEIPSTLDSAKEVLHLTAEKAKINSAKVANFFRTKFPRKEMEQEDEIVTREEKSPVSQPAS